MVICAAPQAATAHLCVEAHLDVGEGSAAVAQQEALVHLVAQQRRHPLRAHLLIPHKDLHARHLRLADTQFIEASMM